MDLEALFSEYLQALDTELRQVVEAYQSGPPGLDLMIHYHLGWVDEQGQPVNLYPGKRIRPLLVLLSAEIAGGDWRQVLPAAAGVELLHNFSLIHDDIEDESPTRRGRPTLWNIWGKPAAINAGDAMFALAHAAFFRLSALGVEPARVLQALEVFEYTNLSLTRGQHLDMAFEDRESVSADEYLEMITGKSAALIEASMSLGALLAGVADDRLSVFASYGLNLGLAFQIRDDILGIWGDPGITGKSAATDVISRKKSLPVVYAMDGDPAFVELYNSPADVDAIVARLDELGVREQTVAVEAGYFDRAWVALGQLPAGRSHALLDSVFNFLMGRVR